MIHLTYHTHAPPHHINKQERRPHDDQDSIKRGAMPAPRVLTLALGLLLLGLPHAAAQLLGGQGPLVLPMRRKLRPDGEVCIFLGVYVFVWRD